MQSTLTNYPSNNKAACAVALLAIRYRRFLSKFLKKVAKLYVLGCAPVYSENEIVYTVIHQPQEVFSPFLNAFVDISAFHNFISSTMAACNSGRLLL